MKNIVQLRNELVETFKDLKLGNLEPKIATEMNNSAGKIINTLKLQLEYAEIRGEKPEIEYMNTEKIEKTRNRFMKITFKR